MYHRKTHTPEELSEARRRASLARVHRRGGRPKGSGKPPSAPSTTASIAAEDLAVIRGLARLRGTSAKAVLHALAWGIVHGAQIIARPELRPDGWEG